MGKENALRHDLKVVTEESRKEDGSISYDLLSTKTIPDGSSFVERWASRKQRDKHHNEGPHIQFFQENGAKNVELTEFAYFLNRVE
ncbi:antibiotic biosynthesis monooxygenase [Ochrobactrum grignonense]|nr:antibiotic biosynthesis monooxygenase [Brucella grignonensis]